MASNETIICESRARGYAPVTLTRAYASHPHWLLQPALHIGAWTALLCLLSSSPGVTGFCLVCRLLSAGATPASTADAPLATLLVASVLTTVGSFAFFCCIAVPLERLYEKQPERRCQTRRARYDIALFFERYDVQLAAANLGISAAATVALGVQHAANEAPSRATMLYLEPPTTLRGAAYLAASAVMLFVWIDLWAYVSHRFLHLPALYRTIHKTHHTWKQTTAFVALGLHPLEFILIFGGVYAAFFAAPLHIGAVAANLLYIHYHNAVDHSGVYFESWLPWQPTSLYHDDHHRMFHVNFGQTFTVWDRLGGTFYQPGRAYSEKAFSW